MPALFDLLEAETEPGVRAVLGTGCLAASLLTRTAMGGWRGF